MGFLPSILKLALPHPQARPTLLINHKATGKANLVTDLRPFNMSDSSQDQTAISRQTALSKCSSEAIKKILKRLEDTDDKPTLKTALMTQLLLTTRFGSGTEDSLVSVKLLTNLDEDELAVLDVFVQPTENFMVSEEPDQGQESEANGENA